MWREHDPTPANEQQYLSIRKLWEALKKGGDAPRPERFQEAAALIRKLSVEYQNRHARG